MKQSYFKKILHTIINFLKMLLLYVIHFFLSLFPNRNQTKIKKIKEEINEIQLKKENKYFESSTSALPEEPAEKIIELKITNEIIEKEIKYIKNNLSNNQLYLLSILEEEIDTYLYKKENIDVKKLDKQEEKIIKQLKEIIIPPITEEIRKNNIENVKELQKEIEKSIITQKKEQQNLEVQTIFKDEPSPYSVVTPLKKELKQKNKTPKPISKNETKIISTTTKEKEIVKEKLENNNTIMVQNQPEIPKLKLKDEITNVITASTLILANIAQELVTTPQQEKKEEKKEDNQPDFVEKQTEVQKDENVQKKDPEEITTFINQDNEKIKKTTEDNNTKNEDKIKTEPTKDNEKNIVNKEQQDIENQINDSNISPILESTNLIIDYSDKEYETEDLEDKNYEELEDRINKMLDKIEEFYLKNEKNMSQEQKKKLKHEMEKLYSLRDNLYKHQENDIKQEEYILERYIEETETKGLKDKLKQMNLEHQLDLEDVLLNNIEDLNNINQKKVAAIEKKLIKQKLKKASKTLEISSLLALPFVRNKYFFYFTIGLLVNNHFNFLNSILKRKTITNNNIDLDKVKRGKEALEESINLNYDNINYLNYLEQEILFKYPELSLDNEYLVYINQLKKKLTKNYEKLSKKRDTIDKYCYKNLKQRKILKKKNITS